MPTASEAKRLNRDVDGAAARSFAYRFLAEAFAFPEREGWDWLQRLDTARAFRAAIEVAWPSETGVHDIANTATGAIASAEMETARDDHLRAFGYTVRGACPPHEIEYGDNRADALFRPHRLANLAALYRAFGMELDELVRERQDHLAIECEFASILAARSAHAIETNHEDGMAACDNAWALFLREHIGRWVPAFASRLDAAKPAPWLIACAKLVAAIVRSDCTSLGIVPGATDVGLVSYDVDGDDFCTDTCGLPGTPADCAPPA